MHLHGGRAGFPWYSRGFQAPAARPPVIIPCTQCHTRFKVPDGKVTARGRKVRCSRCGHTFRIYPDSGAGQGSDPAPAAARPKGPDPFEAFGPEGTSEMEKTPARGTTVSALLAQMEPAPAGEDFDVDVSGVDPASTEPAWNFPPAPSRPAQAAVAVLEPAPGAPDPAPALARAALSVRPLSPAPEPDPEPMSGAFLDVEPDAPEPIPVRALPPRAEGGLAGLFDDQPLETSPSPAEGPPAAAATPPASDDDLASLAGFTPAWGLAAPSRALSVDGTLSRHVSSLTPSAAPEPPPPPRPQFGGAGTVLDDLPSLESPDLSAHGDLELDAGAAGHEWSELSPTGLGGNQIELEPDLPSVELDRRPAPEPPPAPAEDLSWSLPAPAAPSTPAPAPAAAAASPGFGWDDPFAEAPPASRSLAPSSPAPNAVVLDEAPPPSRASPDHGFFDMPSSAPAAEPSGALLPDIPDAVEPPAAAALPATSRPLPTISKPPGRARLGLQERELPGAARRVSAVILNVGLAALLLLVGVGVVSSWASAGRVDGAALSPRRLLQALRPGIGVSPVEVTPGTYETRSGRWLLYVRGRVMNRGAPLARVRVRAEVWDGAQAVKTGETLAGAIATPEELWRAATPADVEALRARLLRAATPVADGQQADFLVLLDEAPRDLSGLRLKVTASVDR